MTSPTHFPTDSKSCEVFSPLSIVIPSYNAARGAGLGSSSGPSRLSVLEQTLMDVFAWLDAAGFDDQRAHVFVVDDGSPRPRMPVGGLSDAGDMETMTDRTEEVVRTFPRPITFLRNAENRGKGYSVRRGVLAALEARHILKSTQPDSAAIASPTGWVLFMDVDNSTPIRHLDRFAPHAKQIDSSDRSGSGESHEPHMGEVLIASRRTLGARIVKRQHRLRQILGRTFPYVVRTIALPDLTDTQCGFKVFRADVAARTFPELRIERFAFDVELLLLARLAGATIVEIPADWENPPESTLRVARDAPRMLLDVVAAVWRLRRGGSIARRLSPR